MTLYSECLFCLTFLYPPNLYLSLQMEKFHSFLCLNRISWYTHTHMHWGCSESKAPIFLMLVRNIICGCWYGSRGWTFLSRFHYMLLLRYKWQQKGSLTKWRLIWKCIWSKGVPLNSSLWKENGIHWYLSTLAEHLWRQNRGCEHS